ncbi:Zinc finger protein [Plakobranchus ocellatus]|uniref:Zinc finger protein n=1 Tax=Plakobranchus ocellatus TaxID=259542 RepID=A0AAV3ZGP3_9GAST|nr:Zinc finger protein [Plakobranchus ocellatus]
MGDKALILLPTELKKLLMQWKRPFGVLATIGSSEYRTELNCKEKTFHANILRRHIARDTVSDETPTADGSLSAASILAA